MSALEPLTAEQVYFSEKYTVQEAAEYLGVSRDTIMRWCKEGIFPNAHKTGPGQQSAWAVPKMDVAAYLEGVTGKPSGLGHEEEE